MVTGSRMNLDVHLDLVGGIAGDMFIAALADARPDLVDGLLACLTSLNPPTQVSFELLPFDDGILNGVRFVTSEPPDKSSHTRFPALCERIQRSKLSRSVASRAIDIFTLLGESEARVHGVPLDKVDFHEVGAWDSVIDVVGAAYFIETLGGSWSCGAVPQGGGFVSTAHGELPVPAPAVTALLEGFEFFDDGLRGERVTPTGAAILRNLITKQNLKTERGKLLRSGIGFGTRKLIRKSNVLRALLFDRSLDSEKLDQVGVIEFEVDDQTAEDLAHALDVLRDRTGVIDVLQWPTFGKKGRLGAHVQVLVAPANVSEVIEACLSETATIGLRWRMDARELLPRETITVDGVVGPVRVKLVELPNGESSAKAENDDVIGVSGGREARRIARNQAEEGARERKK